MKRLIPALIIAASVATAAHAEGPFDGNWKADLSASKLTQKPDVYALKGGQYGCMTCVPSYTIPADGAFHAVTGHAYVDEVAVKVVDPHTVIEEDRKGGRMMSKVTTTITPDGKTMKYTFEDMSAENGQVVTGGGSEMRVAAGAPGSHAVAGSWRDLGPTKVSENGITFTISTNGEAFHYSDPTGVSIDSTFNGPFAPVKGDPGKTMVKVERLNPRTVRQTFMRDGKVTAVSMITVSPNGKTITNVRQDKVHNTTSTFVAVRS